MKGLIVGCVVILAVGSSARSVAQNTESAKTTATKTIPGLMPVDVYQNMEKRGYKTTKDFTDGSRLVWMCSKRLDDGSGGGFVSYSVEAFGPTATSVHRVNAAVGASIQKDASAVALPELLYVASLLYDGSEPKKAQEWVRNNIGKKARTVIGGVVYEIDAPAKTGRWLSIYVADKVEEPDEKASPSATSKKLKLGVWMISIDELRKADTEKALDIPTKVGAVIKDVVPGSPAEASGLKKFDIIQKVGETQVDSPEELVQWLDKAMLGKEYTFTIYRPSPSDLKFERRMIRITLGSVALPTESGSDSPTKDREAAAQEAKVQEAAKEARRERAKQDVAASYLKTAKSLRAKGDAEAAKKWLNRIVKEYSETEAAKEAVELLGQ